MTNQDCLRRVFLLYGNLMSNGITMHIGIFGISFEAQGFEIGFFDGLNFSTLEYKDASIDPKVATQRSYLISQLNSLLVID